MKINQEHENYYAIVEKILSDLANQVVNLKIGLRHAERILHMQNGLLGRIKK